MSKIQIIGQGIIQSMPDFFGLHIVDFSRLNNYWPHLGEAIDHIAGYVVRNVAWTKVRVNMHAIPNRDDWPGWNHVGTHEDVGRAYWNWWNTVNTGQRKNS
jgi:hypothetical protein